MGLNYNKANGILLLEPAGYGCATCFGPASACANVTPTAGGGGFTLLAPVPGTAGVPNDLPATGATASGQVFYMMGDAAG